MAARLVTDIWLYVAVFCTLGLAVSVWRIFCGLRMDPFERQLRAHRRGDIPSGHDNRDDDWGNNGGSSAKQVTLLTYLLGCAALGILIAQAVQPEDWNRPLTWLVITALGAWRGAVEWGDCRGWGPLRNQSWGAAWGATITSTTLWSFYMAVGMWRPIPTHVSWTTLMWWVVAGGALGVLLGDWRANRRYRRLHLSHDKLDGTLDVAVTNRSNSRSSALVAVAMAASLMFHLATVPALLSVVTTVKVVRTNAPGLWLTIPPTLTLPLQQKSMVAIQVEPISQGVGTPQGNSRRPRQLEIVDYSEPATETRGNHQAWVESTIIRVLPEGHFDNNRLLVVDDVNGGGVLIVEGTPPTFPLSDPNPPIAPPAPQPDIVILNLRDLASVNAEVRGAGGANRQDDPVLLASLEGRQVRVEGFLLSDTIKQLLGMSRFHLSDLPEVVDGVPQPVSTPQIPILMEGTELKRWMDKRLYVFGRLRRTEIPVRGDYHYYIRATEVRLAP